jgi:hypothetical protein
MKKFTSIQALVLCASLALPVASCGLTLAQDVVIGQGVVSAVQMVVTAIRGWEQNYFTQNPNAAKQTEIEKAIASTLAADAFAQDALSTTGDFSSGNVIQAFARLQADYGDLLVLLKDLGVVSAPTGSNLTAEPLAGRLYVLAPETLVPKGMDGAKVSARANAMRAAR